MTLRITDPAEIARFEALEKGRRNPSERPVGDPSAKTAAKARKPHSGAQEPGECTLWLQLDVKGKARARTFQDRDGQAKTRHRSDYRRWLKRAREQLELQWLDRDPLERAEVHVTFWGGSRRNDGDNGIGSVLDALVKAGVLVDDNLLRVPVGSWRYQHAETPRIQIELIW